MTELSYAWVDADGGDPPWVHVTLTPPRIRESVLQSGKSVSTKPIQSKSMTGAGTMTAEPGPYKCSVSFGDPARGQYVGAGWINSTDIVISGDTMDLRTALEAAQVTPPPNWVSVLGGMIDGLANTYAPAFAASTSIVTDPVTGRVTSVTENGIVTMFTYNPDGTVATDTRSGTTRTYTYDGAGNLTGIEAV